MAFAPYPFDGGLNATSLRDFFVWCARQNVSDIHVQGGIRAGNKLQRREGQRIWLWLARHGREVEQAWGTTRAGEFAMALQRLPPHKRSTLQTRLTGCVLIVPADRFDDLSLLLPSGKTAEAALTSRSWDTYTRSDLYAEPDSLG